MKFLLALFLFSSIVFSKTIDNSLLSIHASLIPKILLLELDIKNKIKNNKILITIAYERSNHNDMKFIRNNILSKYPNGISEYEIEVESILYKKISECNKNTNILYLLPSSHEQISKIVKIHRPCQTITFASHQEYLQNKVMISVDIGKKVTPVLNLDAIKESNINFKPVLLSISKIYTNK